MVNSSDNILAVTNISRSKSSVSNHVFGRLTEYERQYYKTYCIRLERLNEVVENRLKEIHGNNIIIKRLADLIPEESCVIIGTLYKHMEHKPSVIKELTDAYQLGMRPLPSHKLTSVNDRLFLEDSQQRIELANDSINVSKYVTGVVVALLGYESEKVKGIFVVKDVVHATPLFPLIKNPGSGLPPSRYIALISGIGIEDSHGVSIRLKLTLDWMCGSLFMSCIPIDPRTIGRLIIAGNSVLDSCRNKVASQNKFITMKTNMNSDLPMEVLDRLLNAACPSIPIDIMPGANDPTSIVLPQKALHKIMFPKSSRWTTFNTRSNPWMFDLDNGAFVVGSSGQNVDDIDRYSEINDPLDRLRANITWGHMAPTAPDTLPSYPNAHATDPLILPYKPYLYFAGNQDTFQWSKMEEEGNTSMLVTIPRFKDTGAVVLVDIHQNSCMCINFT